MCFLCKWSMPPVWVIWSAVNVMGHSHSALLLGWPSLSFQEEILRIHFDDMWWRVMTCGKVLNQLLYGFYFSEELLKRDNEELRDRFELESRTTNQAHWPVWPQSWHLLAEDISQVQKMRGACIGMFVFENLHIQFVNFKQYFRLQDIFADVVPIIMLWEAMHWRFRNYWNIRATLLRKELNQP